jgi:hypothetical protein
MGWHESIEHARFRALAQIIVDKEKGIKAFEDYMKLAFPYLEAAKRKERSSHVDILKQEIARGAIAVRPMQAPKVRSRVGEARANRSRPQSTNEEKRIYGGLGRTV